MDGGAGKRLVRLTDEQRALAASGTFVRVDIGAYSRASDGTKYRTAFVARIAGAASSGGGDGSSWVAYANVCRHHPVDLDVPDAVVDGKTGLRIALLGQDGVSLMCASHGALYRPSDGFCTTGPCFGQRLAALDLVIEGDAVSLAVSDAPETRKIV